MGKKIKVSDEHKKYDWIVFATSYLYIARLACQELLSQRKGKYSKSQDTEFPYTTPDLFVSILFNIKHGFEIFVKGLGVFAYGEYTEDHDIHELFTDVKNRISSTHFPPDESPFYDQVTDEERNAIPTSLDLIEKFVPYFYNIDILKQKMVGSFIIKDTKNDVFRYPSNKAEIEIDWATILTTRIFDSDIQEILGKLVQLTELLNATGYTIARLDRRRK